MTAECVNPSGVIGDSCGCDYETVDRLNVDFATQLQQLVKTPFFRYFKVNLYRDCPFWEGGGLCMNRDCSVETMDEQDVPEKWKSSTLGKVSMAPNPLLGGRLAPPKRLLKDQDFCIIESPSDDEAVYVDLGENPERFTGYSGASANMVWKAIYEENCFDVSKEMTASCQYCTRERERVAHLKEEKHKKHQQEQKEKKEKIQTMAPEELEEDHVDSPLEPPQTARMKETVPTQEEMDAIFEKVPQGKGQLEQLMQHITDKDDAQISCLEKRVYYRLISGLHSSISIHICDEWFNQTTGEWGPNLDCFISRVGMHPERLENIYFDYAVLLRAVSKVSDYLAGYEFCTGEPSIDHNIKALMNEVIDLAKKCPPTFDERTLFKEKSSLETIQLKQQFRDHFRNVSRIMDCVGCEKCRLWGKVQTQGLGTALKLLFSYDDRGIQQHVKKAAATTRGQHDILERSEIVALFNTFNRFSESITAIERFRRMYQERLDEQRNAKKQQSQQQQQQQVQAALEGARVWIQTTWQAAVAKGWDAASQIDQAMGKRDVLHFRVVVDALRNQFRTWFG
ncbi:hypothetical protein DFQ27_007415 [Actinomortierella ambigua]|uniref:Endoplasmic oxidoreductin-1 n=1 Tax=Actinomortierella ambigua TaxID=1343610 RepID=A0A9P6PUT7_9FUNG|nr:hypothetical protein DFQ27_007415 [Actinomortierella ambigua]